MLTPHVKIYVAGHRGLVGSAIVRQLKSEGCKNLLLKTHKELDLIDQSAVRSFFERERPDIVVLAAAKVGGILANSTYPAEFIYENLIIQSNIIHWSQRTGVKRLLFLGSSCIFPKLAPQPLKEEFLLTGLLEPTNDAYAVAKIAGIKMCESYNRQYGTGYLSVMPTNLYGPGDNFDLENSHVLPALIRKFHEAMESGAPEVVVWGSGFPRREFLHVNDIIPGPCRETETLSHQHWHG
jgi:GDP-L-fucose synthase